MMSSILGDPEYWLNEDTFGEEEETPEERQAEEEYQDRRIDEYRDENG